MNEIEAFTFYRNYYEIIRYLPSKEKIQLYDAILDYMFQDKEPNLDGLANGIWVNLKMPLNTSKCKIINGKKGGRPKTKTKSKQNLTDNLDNNLTDNLNKTKSETETKANNISYFLFLISNNYYKYIVNNSNIYNKLIEWFKYKQKRKEMYKENGLRNLLSEVENNIDIYGEEEVINLITECMKKRYKGIIFKKLKTKNNQSIEEVVNYMNELAGTSYKSNTDDTGPLIKARLDEGFTVDDLKDVVFYTYKEWVENKKEWRNGVYSDKYFRPLTIFAGDKFQGYLQDYKRNYD